MTLTFFFFLFIEPAVCIGRGEKDDAQEKQKAKATENSENKVCSQSFAQYFVSTDLKTINYCIFIC